MVLIISEIPKSEIIGPFMKPMVIPTQVSIFLGCQIGISLFTIKPALSSVSCTNFEVGVDFSNPKSIPMPFSKRHGVLIIIKHKNLTNGLTTLVKTNGAVDNPKVNFVKTY